MFTEVTGMVILDPPLKLVAVPTAPPDIPIVRAVVNVSAVFAFVAVPLNEPTNCVAVIVFVDGLTVIPVL